MAERIDELTVPLAPELVGKFVVDLSARLDRACPERVGVVGVDLQRCCRAADRQGREDAEVGELARDMDARIADPKRYQVSFLSEEPNPDVVQKLAAFAAGDERLVAIGRELYAWHPDSVARSRLWARLAGPALGVTATARNWTTVTRLLALADGS